MVNNLLADPTELEGESPSQFSLGSAYGASILHMNNVWVRLSRQNKFAASTHLSLHQRKRLAGVALDHAASVLFAVLDENTSVRWIDLVEHTDLTWPDVCRGIAVLVDAGICQPGPSRVRLTETGANMLAESHGTITILDNDQSR